MKGESLMQKVINYTSKDLTKKSLSYYLQV